MAAHASVDFHRLSAHDLNSPHVLNSPKSLLAPATVNKRCESPVAALFSSMQELLARLAAVAAPVQPAVQGGQPERPGQLAAPGQPAAPRNIDSLDDVIGSIHDPFRGIPPREDWIDLWADSTSFISIRKAGSFEGEARIGAKGDI